MVLPVSCREGDRVVEIRETRQVDTAVKTADPGMTSAQRFGFQPAPTRAPSESAAPPLVWAVPDGWGDGLPNPMRAGSFIVAGSPETECYVAVLSGDGGGVAANVNRWRRQMGAESLSPEEIGSLPTITVLGQPCPVVELSGVFTPMSGPSRADWCLLGVVCSLPDETVFVKMTGPEDVVRGQRARFVSFCESLAPVPGE